MVEVITRTTYACGVCGSEYSEGVVAEACEAQVTVPKPSLQPMQWVYLSAAGLKNGREYVRARVVEVQLYAEPSLVDRAIRKHRWRLWLDRNVRLVECWGEGGYDLDDPYMRDTVDADFLLPDAVRLGREPYGEKWDRYHEPGVWVDVSAKYTDRYPWQVAKWPSDGGVL